MMAARIRRMPRRRAKIALKRRVRAALQPFVGKTITPGLRADIVLAAMGAIHVDLSASTTFTVKISKNLIIGSNGGTA